MKFKFQVSIDEEIAKQWWVINTCLQFVCNSELDQALNFEKKERSWMNLSSIYTCTASGLALPQRNHIILIGTFP